MAQSFTRKVFNGASDRIPVAFPYLDKSHVLVYLDGVLQASNTYSWPTAGEIQLNSTPANGVVGYAPRRTPETPITVFSPGNLDVGDLNVGSLQPLYLAQEARDAGEDTTSRGWTTAALGMGGTITKGTVADLVGYDELGNMVPRAVPEIFDLNFATVEQGELAETALQPMTAELPPTNAYGFAGFSAKARLLVMADGNSPTTPDFGGSFQLRGTAGAGDPYGAFKVALTAVYQGEPGSADGWAANFVASSAVGLAAATGLIGLEVDVNNNHVVSNGLDGTPYTAGIYLSGAGVGRNDAAIIIAGSTGLWYDGIHFEDVTDVGSRLIEGSAIHDNSKSRNVVLSATAHENGIHFGSATFSSAAIRTPGFIVGPTGGISATSLNVGSGLFVLGGTGDATGKSLGVGSGIEALGAQSPLHSYATSGAFQMLGRYENNNGGSGSAAIGLQVTSTAASEVRSAKAGMFLTRGAGNGRGVFGLANRVVNDTSDFSASDYVIRWDASNNLSLVIGGVSKTITVDGSGFVKAA